MFFEGLYGCRELDIKGRKLFCFQISRCAFAEVGGRRWALCGWNRVAAIS